MALVPFVELLGRSCFSFLEGASRPEELVEQAVQLGLGGLGLIDRDGLYGSVRAHGAAKAKGLPLVVGAELCFRDSPSKSCSGVRLGTR